MGAQGMNTGLQDAYNLAWKLALVVQASADAALLDTYEQERIARSRSACWRRPIARSSVLLSRHWFARLMRTKLIARSPRRAMKFERVRNSHSARSRRSASAIPSSALSQTAGAFAERCTGCGRSLPLAADEAAAVGPAEDLYGVLDDRRFNLLVFGSREQTSNWRTSVTSSRPGSYPTTPRTEPSSSAAASRSVIFLVRPDGHIGLCGATADAAVIGKYIAGGSVRLRNSTVTMTGASFRQPMAHSGP